MSHSIVRLQRKGQMVIPRALREEAGIPEGTLLKLAVVNGCQILLTPQLTIDRSIVSHAPSKSRKQSLRELVAVVDELRQEAKEKGLDKMPKREINVVVKAARSVVKLDRKPIVK